MWNKQTNSESCLSSPGHLCKDIEAFGIFQVLDGQKYG